MVCCFLLCKMAASKLVHLNNIYFPSSTSLILFYENTVLFCFFFGRYESWYVFVAQIDGETNEKKKTHIIFQSKKIIINQYILKDWNTFLQNISPCNRRPTVQAYNKHECNVICDAKNDIDILLDLPLTCHHVPHVLQISYKSVEHK